MKGAMRITIALALISLSVMADLVVLDKAPKRYLVGWSEGKTVTVKGCLVVSKDKLARECRGEKVREVKLGEFEASLIEGTVGKAPVPDLHTLILDIEDLRSGIEREEVSDVSVAQDHLRRLESFRNQLIVVKRALSALNSDETVVMEEEAVRRVLAGLPFSDFTFNNHFEFVRVEPGQFMMGSPQTEKDRDDDEKRHPVTISQPFEIQTTEVTQSLWEKVMGSLPEELNQPGNARFKGPDKPIVFVSWNDITRKDIDPKTGKAGFLVELNRLGKGTFSLPTEAQWEYAARGGNDPTAKMTATYSFGNDPTDLPRFAVFNSNQTEKVKGNREPNPIGLYDMHGNAEEWVQDLKRDDYEKLSSTDPINDSTGSYRVVRGGSWFGNARNLRSAFRDDFGPDIRSCVSGFRLLRTP